MALASQLSQINSRTVGQSKTMHTDFFVPNTSAPTTTNKEP